MFCQKCGAAVSEGQKFCLACGADLSQQTAPQADPQSAYRQEQPAVETQNAFAQAYSPFPEGGESEPPKKKKRGKAIVLGALALVLAAAVLAVTLNWKFISNQYAKMTMSEEEYLTHVYETGLKDMLSGAFGAAGSIGALVDENDFSSEFSVKAELGQAAKDLLSSFAPEEIANMNIPSVVYQGTLSKKGEAAGGSVTLGTGEGNIVTLQYGIDAEGAITLRIPELSDTAVKVTPPENGAENEGQIPSAPLAALTASDALGAAGTLADEELLLRLLTKYVGFVLDEFEEVEAEETTLEVEDVKEQCTVYKAKFDEDNAQKALENILKAVKTDEDVKTILSETFKAQKDLDFETVYKSFQDEIDRALESMAESKVFDADSFPTIRYVTYVNAMGEIIGMELEIEELEMHCYNVKNGDKFATEILLDSNDVIVFEFEGSGSRKGDLVNAEYALKAMGEKYFGMEVENWNAASAEKGMLNGSVTMKLGSALTERLPSNIPSEIASMIQTAGLKLEFTSPSATEITVKTSVLFGKEPLITLTVWAKLDKAKEIPVFDRVIDTNDEAAMNAWSKELTENVGKLIEAARTAGVPEEMLRIPEFSDTAVKPNPEYDPYQGREDFYTGTEEEIVEAPLLPEEEWDEDGADPEVNEDYVVSIPPVFGEDQSVSNTPNSNASLVVGTNPNGNGGYIVSLKPDGNGGYVVERLPNGDEDHSIHMDLNGDGQIGENEGMATVRPVSPEISGDYPIVYPNTAFGTAEGEVVYEAVVPDTAMDFAEGKVVYKAVMPNTAMDFAEGKVVYKAVMPN